VNGVTTTRNRLIDLSSDTATRPTAGMRKAMAEADVGDEQKGEDPTTRALEERVAELLGHEAGVFLPSGTMCNQIALAVHTTKGDEVLAAETSHIFVYESGGGAALAGSQSWPIRTSNGLFAGADVTANLRDQSRYHPRTKLVCVEQTSNIGGGAIWPLAQLKDVAAAARRHNLLLHMDGARLPNAVVGSGVPARDMVSLFDTAWLDLSKGLGCPVGAVLVGSKGFIKEAWRWKQRIGGALRQSGIVAAAGLYALDHHWERLADDHRNAQRLKELTESLKGVQIYDPGVATTNLVFFDVKGTGRPAVDIVAAMQAKGVRMTVSYGSRIRAVTHLDVSAGDIEIAGRAFAEAVGARNS
jgi:threonine aldolase